MFLSVSLNYRGGECIDRAGDRVEGAPQDGSAVLPGKTTVVIMGHALETDYQNDDA